MAFKKDKVQEAVKEAQKILPPPQSLEEKFKSLSTLSKALDKKHETTNTLMRLGDKVGIVIPHIVTGLPTFDNDVLGCGGIPRGRMIEVFGPESAGKTTTCLHIVGKEQETGGLAAFVDAEHALDPTYAHHLGVDVDNLIVSQPESGEKALDTVEELVDSRCVSIVVVDSVAALTPEAELAGEIGDCHVGLQARLMSQTMRKLTGKCAKTGVTILWINQIREKIGIMFGNPETTPGGRALKFYSSVRLEVKRRKEIKDNDVLVGHQLEIKAVKNKCATPFRSCTVDLYYPGTLHSPGLDQIGDTIDYASSLGIFEMSGSWYSLDLGQGMERLANGLANLKNVLRDNKQAVDIIRKKIDERVKMGVVKTEL